MLGSSLVALSEPLHAEGVVRRPVCDGVRHAVESVKPRVRSAAAADRERQDSTSIDRVALTHTHTPAEALRTRGTVNVKEIFFLPTTRAEGRALVSDRPHDAPPGRRGPWASRRGRPAAGHRRRTTTRRRRSRHRQTVAAVPFVAEGGRRVPTRGTCSRAIRGSAAGRSASASARRTDRPARVAPLQHCSPFRR